MTRDMDEEEVVVEEANRFEFRLQMHSAKLNETKNEKTKIIWRWPVLNKIQIQNNGDSKNGLSR